MDFQLSEFREPKTVVKEVSHLPFSLEEEEEKKIIGTFSPVVLSPPPLRCKR